MTTDLEWQLTATGKSHFDGLNEYGRERIASKLDEIAPISGGSLPTTSNRLLARPTKSFGSARFDSRVGLVDRRTYCTYSAFESAAVTPIAVMTELMVNKGISHVIDPQTPRTASTGF